MQQASRTGKYATGVQPGKTCNRCQARQNVQPAPIAEKRPRAQSGVPLVVLLIGLKFAMVSLIGQATMKQNSKQFLPFVLEESLKETQITSPYDGLKYTHSELTIFRPNG